MGRTTQGVIRGRKIELSNLDKVLFPQDHVVKAELIEYYLKIAPTIVRHIKNRPLSLVRFPEGITGESFFQRNRPEWAPDWVAHALLGDIDYILANEEAVLAWVANLACIEIHQMHSRSPRFENPDYIVFDFDPPESCPFGEVVGVVLAFKGHVEGLGYHPFVKTSGAKGLHVFVPIEPRSSFDEAFEAASKIARPFVDAHQSSTTLQIKKEARKGRILVDIYRNRPSQTIVSPYSVRARPAAPVSMPVTWEQLTSLKSSAVFNLRTVPGLLAADGDAWETIGALATPLYPESRMTSRSVSRSRRQTGTEVPEKLETYARKRSFEKTPEPPPGAETGRGDAFVVHRHHASRLHYDLGLESEGALKSWAVPKGLPPRPGVKRLAVAVEDHPLRYLEFEGTIPKGEYGAGRMWVFARGKYEITKQKKEGFYFALHSREMDAEYRFISTGGKDWLLERVDMPQTDWLRDPVEPMLAESREKLPNSLDYLYEIKWEGIRALVALDEGKLSIRSRGQTDITRLFPELTIPEEAFRAACGLFDGEIVCLDTQGKPVLKNVMERLQQGTDSAVARARRPAVCYLFDCLYLDGRPLLKEALEKRREWLADAIRATSAYRLSEGFEDGAFLCRVAAEKGLEGIIAKGRGSPYAPGKRTPHWLKIKTTPEKPRHRL